MKSLKFLSILLLVFLLTSCFGSVSNEKPQENSQGQSVVQKGENLTSEERLKINTEQKRIKTLDKLTSENLGAMLKKTDGKIELFDRRLFINYLKAKNINSTEKLSESFKEIEDFVKEEGITLSKTDILVTLIGFDQEVTSYDMCGDFGSKKTKINKETTVFKELSEFCSQGSIQK